MRLDNEKYIREHPELAKLMRSFLHSVLSEKPENITAHAHSFFTRDTETIQKDLDQVN